MSGSDTEKQALGHTGIFENVSITRENSESERAVVEAFTSEAQKSLIRRVDRRLVATLGLLYSVSLMDRTNLGNASIAG
jgi:hypothetical protein